MATFLLGSARTNSLFKGTAAAFKKFSLNHHFTRNMEDLGNVKRLSAQVVRVLGQNPGKFTLQGTNTYLVGRRNPYILVDAAQGIPEYIPILESALNDQAAPSDPSQPDVSDVIISHWHPDHVDGLPSVLELLKRFWERRNPNSPYVPPRLHKYPIPEGTLGSHLSSDHFTLSEIVSSLGGDLYTPSPNGKPFHDLYDGQNFPDHTGETLLRVLHTPGHTVDSIALLIPPDRALYTADTVLGHGTAVFEDLGVYLTSLRKMLDFHKEEPRYDILYPAHGGVVKNGSDTIAMYIQHRLEREKEILSVLGAPLSENLVAEGERSGDGGKSWTTWNLVRQIYKKYPENLWLPACRSVDLHLRKLEGEGVVSRKGGDAEHTQWELILKSQNPGSLL